MIDLINLVEPLQLSIVFFFGFVLFLSFLLIAGFSYFPVSKLFQAFVKRFEPGKIYRSTSTAFKLWLILTIVVIALDAIFLKLPSPTWLEWLEFPLAIIVAIDVCLFSFQVINKLFDNYLLGVALEDQTKINSELLALSQYLSKATTVLIVIFCFAQTHQINLIGLVASLGIAGATIAFASQKVIEEILWSIVLLIDRPFNVDDYIHLQDRTMGRVESIGWRSTKIRLSGKNTLAVIPNSNIVKENIENLSRAKRVISMITLTFFTTLSENQKALIRQLILESTDDILGIDSELTQVTFKEIVDRAGRPCVRAQVIFFILGSTSASMELRRGLLEIARDNIVNRLQVYGIAFDCEQATVDVPQPMNI